MIVYDATVDGTVHTMGTSGFLYRSNKLMYDRATHSLWSTLTGEPVVGPLVGKGIALDVHPSVVTTWGAWREKHPETSVLTLRTGHLRDYGEGVAYRDYFATDELMFTVPEVDKRMANKESVLALRFTQHPTVVDLRKLPRVAHLTVEERPIVVITDSGGGRRVYDALDLRLVEAGDGLKDADGNVWHAKAHGLFRADGASRPRLPAHEAFWFGWRAAFPNTRVVGGP